MCSKEIVLTGIMMFLRVACFTQEGQSYNVDSLIQTDFRPWHLEEFREVQELSSIYIEYGKQENNNKVLAQGLYGMGFSENTDTVVKYTKQLIKLTEKWKDDFYYTLPHMLLGSTYYNDEKAELALKAFNAGYERSKQTNNIIRIVDYLNAIGGVKGTYGKQEEAIVMHHKALYLTKTNRKLFGSEYELQMIYNYDNIAVHYLEQRVLDSAFYYIDAARTNFDLDTYPYFKDGFEILEAQTNYYSGNYAKCKTVLESLVNNYEDLEKADMLYFIAKSEEVFGNIKQRDSLLEEIDAIMDVNPYPVDNTPEVYSVLLRNAVNKDDKPKQLKYLEKLIYFDSLIVLNQEKVKAIAVDPEFTMENLKQMRFELNRKLEKRGNVLSVSITLAFFFLMGCSYFVLKYRSAQKRLQEILKSDIQTVTGKAINDENKLEPVMQNLLLQLNQWEENLGFLDRKITQKTLARLLDTNDTYLSKLVNEYKKLSFSNYLKDLRITYCINDLKNWAGVALIFVFSTLPNTSKELKP